MDLGGGFEAERLVDNGGGGSLAGHMCTLGGGSRPGLNLILFGKIFGKPAILYPAVLYPAILYPAPGPGLPHLELSILALLAPPPSSLPGI